MIFILLLLYCIFINIHSKLINYTLYQTNHVCQYNWKRSICLPIFSLNETNQPLVIKLDIDNENQCLTQTLVYIRSRQCIYCAKNVNDIYCNHHRSRRMIPINKEHIHRNQVAIISVSLLGVLIIGSLLTLLFIKRSQAHTNLLELFNPQTNSNIKSIKVPQNIKSTHLTVPKSIKSTK